MMTNDFGVSREVLSELHRRELDLADLDRAHLQQVIDFGKVLTKAKAECRHGEWQEFLEANVRRSARWCRDAMLLASRRDEIPPDVLTVDAALRLVRDKTPPRPTANEQLTEDSLRVLEEMIGRFSADIHDTMEPIFGEEGLTDNHAAVKLGKRLRAAVGALREFVRTQLSTFNRLPPEEADAMETLGLRWPFTPDDLDAAYRECAKQTHPDHGGSGAKFIEVQRAMECLQELLTAV